MHKQLAQGIFRLFLLFTSVSVLFSCHEERQRPEFTLVIHGGAGTITRENMTAEREALYTAKLTEALDSGTAILSGGGTALDAVQAAVKVMEDSPLFNAGRGSVFNERGRNEMDASIMDGHSGRAGAVASVQTIRNPILAARQVMDNSPHVLLVGRGAEAFALRAGLEMADSAYFFNQDRYQAHLEGQKHGTVGAVALDCNGHLAAATSTGGKTNKMEGRVGDSPIIGAGTYANDVCAVSGTGDGEYYIRDVIAYDIAALMMYKGLTLQEACGEVIMNKLSRQNGTGGVIAVDGEGNISMTFNTKGMYRGVALPDGTREVKIYE